MSSSDESPIGPEYASRVFNWSEAPIPMPGTHERRMIYLMLADGEFSSEDFPDLTDDEIEEVLVRVRHGLFEAENDDKIRKHS